MSEIEELEGWDSEMDDLVRWFQSWSCPEAPFSIGDALEVVDRSLFLAELKDQIDRCSSTKKEEVPQLRRRLKSLRTWMSSDPKEEA